MASIPEAIRDFWDADAHTYDRGVDHVPRSSLERAAWSSTLLELLPAPPARVLDAGAGTGFLTLFLARLGYEVTALDVSAVMLERLRTKAEDSGLSVATVESSAERPPEGPFDAVVERHLLWTLPEPAAALDAWRSATPRGRLVLFEALWGAGAGPAEQLRRRGRAFVRRLRREHPGHHGHYAPAMLDALPLGSGPDPRRVVDLVESTHWGPARIARLRDVEWAATRELPYPERTLGVPARFAVVAGD